MTARKYLPKMYFMTKNTCRKCEHVIAFKV